MIEKKLPPIHPGDILLPLAIIPVFWPIGTVLDEFAKPVDLKLEKDRLAARLEQEVQVYGGVAGFQGERLATNG